MLDTSELFEVFEEDNFAEDMSLLEELKNSHGDALPPGMTDFEIWANYTNETLYEMDKKVREFLKRTSWKRQSSKTGYKTTVPIVFTWVFGRRATPSDGIACRYLHKLLEYYCTSWKGPTSYKGQKVSRVYSFSKYSCTQRRPYSIRLRMEINDAEGKGWAIFRPGTRDNVKKQRELRRRNRKDGVDATVGSSDDSGGQASDDRPSEEL